MDAKTKYLLFCIEVYKRKRGLNGAQVYALFKKYDFFQYIIDFYEMQRNDY